MPRPTDAQLVARAREGDLAAFGAIVDRHRAALVAVAAGRLGSLADAEDVAQEALVKAFFRLSQLRKPESLLPWLRRLTDRIALMRLRSRQDEPWEPERLTAVCPVSPPRDEAAQLLEQLPPPMRQTLTLTYLAGYTCAETAALLGIREGTVKSRLSRARALLKEGFAVTKGEMKKSMPKQEFAKRTFQRLMREARRLMEKGDIEAAGRRADQALGAQAEPYFAAGQGPMEVPWDEEAARIKGAGRREQRRKECEANAALYGYRLEDLDWELEDVNIMSGTLAKPTGRGRDWWGIPFSRQEIRIHEARDTMRRLHCSPQTLYGWIKQGMPVLRCWPFVRFDWNLIDKWLQANAIADWPKESDHDLDRPVRLILKAVEKGGVTARQAEEILDALGVQDVCLAA